jgi:hypothetical protein
MTSSHCTCLHNEFRFKVVDLTVIRVHKYLQEQEEFISMLAIVFFDEVGVSAHELLLCIDFILCMVKKSDVVLGGKFSIVKSHILQLGSIQSICRSMNMYVQGTQYITHALEDRCMR